MPRGSNPLLAHYWHFHGRGVSKLTIYHSLNFSFFHSWIKISRENWLNGHKNAMKNGANNGNFESPYCQSWALHLGAGATEEVARGPNTVTAQVKNGRSREYHVDGSSHAHSSYALRPTDYCFKRGYSVALTGILFMDSLSALYSVRAFDTGAIASCKKQQFRVQSVVLNVGGAHSCSCKGVKFIYFWRICTHAPVPKKTFFF